MDIYDSFAYIEDFPDYCVTERGEVINIRTNRTLTLSPTQHGDLTVGLMKDGWQYRRSVKVLVARAFVEGETDIFDTPIQLDGDKRNLHASNIMWRPRWFAWKYHKQFDIPYPDWFYAGPIMDITSNQRYHCIFEAAIGNGLLCEEIHLSLKTSKFTFPTAQIFVQI